MYKIGNFYFWTWLYIFKLTKRGKNQKTPKSPSPSRSLSLPLAHPDLPQTRLGVLPISLPSGVGIEQGRRRWNPLSPLY